MLSNINTRIGSAINYVSVNVYNLYNRTVSETMNEYRERLGVNINTISCSILDAISFVSDFDITFYENPRVISCFNSNNSGSDFMGKHQTILNLEFNL